MCPTRTAASRPALPSSCRLQHGGRFRSAVLSALFALLLIAGAARQGLPQACDPSLACGAAITCVDGLEYPTTCGPDNCDLPIGLCTVAVASGDSFASASGIGGASGRATGSNAGAGKEPGEPDHAGDRGGASLWWSWTAPDDGMVTIDTAGSDVDTLLAVYTGGAVDALAEVASNDDAVGVQSAVRFTAQEGVVYRIAVDGYDGATGSVVLNWSQAGDPVMACDPSLVCGAARSPVSTDWNTPPPAVLATATCPSGCARTSAPTAPAATASLRRRVSGARRARRRGATPGRARSRASPTTPASRGGASLWWSWTAPDDGMVTIDTAGSDVDTLLAVYTGSIVGALAEVASNDDAVGVQSAVRFTAQRGVVYRIAVDGYDGATGSVVLSWSQAGDPGAVASVSLSAAAAEMDEGADRTPVVVTVTLSEPVAGDVTVALASTGTARLGSDFDLGSASVTVTAGATRGTTTVTPIRDLEAEGDETVVLEIDAVAGSGDLGAPSTVRIDIRDLGALPPADYAELDGFMLLSGGETWDIDTDALYFTYIVRNRGRVAASPTEAVLVTTTDLFSDADPYRRLATRPVPALEAGGSRFLDTVRVPFDALVPGSNNYLVLAIPLVAEEDPDGRRVAVDYSAVFLTDGSRIPTTCTGFSRDTRPGVADPLFGQQWALYNTGQTAFTARGGVAGEDLNMAQTLLDGPTGAGVRVAVVDSGLEICHPDLAANAEPGLSYNFGYASWLGAQADDPFLPTVLGDHGTSVAGLIAAAANNGVGGRGVAPQVRLRGFNYLSYQSPGAYFDALGMSSERPQADDVHVFNMSFGSSGGAGGLTADERELFRTRCHRSARRPRRPLRQGRRQPVRRLHPGGRRRPAHRPAARSQHRARLRRRQSGRRTQPAVRHHGRRLQRRRQAVQLLVSRGGPVGGGAGRGVRPGPPGHDHRRPDGRRPRLRADPARPGARRRGQSAGGLHQHLQRHLGRRPQRLGRHRPAAGDAARPHLARREAHPRRDRPPAAYRHPPRAGGLRRHAGGAASTAGSPTPPAMPSTTGTASAPSTWTPPWPLPPSTPRTAWGCSSRPPRCGWPPVSAYRTTTAAALCRSRTSPACRARPASRRCSCASR